MDERKMYDLPYLIAFKPIPDEFTNFNKIALTSEEHTIGRGRENSTVIPVLTISRNHCKLKKMESMDWHLFDYSTFGIEINGIKVGKGSEKKLCNGDIIKMNPTDEFTYKFVIPNDDEYNVPRKRIKLESNPSNTEMINNVKVKFEQSQNYERLHIEQKMETAKQMTAKSMILKQQLQSDMDRKMQKLEDDYAVQIEKLTGAKNEVERKTDLLIKERDAQLFVIQQEMGSKVAELMEQIKQHSENEAQLSMENNLLKEKLENERQAFLAELLRESSSKQDMLDQLEKKIQEQENIRKKEKEELEDMHKKENELLRLAMEKELKELEEQRKQREEELKKELESIKENLEKQVKQTEEQESKAKQELIEKLQEMQQLSDIEKVKVEKLEKEKEEMKQKHEEVQIKAKMSIIDLMDQVKKKETEITNLATEKIQKQVDESSEVIQTLQQELAMANNKLKEKESNTTTQDVYIIDPEEGTSSKNSVLNEVGSIMENELQCSVCAELFIEATTLGCSHTFCAYCIGMWKKKKKDCPVCRTPITTECRSLVLDSFIEKMVQNLSEEMKVKRQDMLQSRKEEAEGSGADNNRSKGSINSSEISDFEYTEGEGSQEGEGDSSESDELDDERFYESDDTPSDSSRGLDDASDTDLHTSRHGYIRDYRGYIRRILESTQPIGRFYGGYGRCFECGARGHWAPQCPFR